MSSPRNIATIQADQAALRSELMALNIAAANGAAHATDEAVEKVQQKLFALEEEFAEINRVALATALPESDYEPLAREPQVKELNIDLPTAELEIKNALGDSQGAKIGRIFNDVNMAGNLHTLIHSLNEDFHLSFAAGMNQDEVDFITMLKEKLEEKESIFDAQKKLKPWLANQIPLNERDTFSDYMYQLFISISRFVFRVDGSLNEMIPGKPGFFDDAIKKYGRAFVVNQLVGGAITNISPYITSSFIRNTLNHHSAVNSLCTTELEKIIQLANTPLAKEVAKAFEALYYQERFASDFGTLIKLISAARQLIDAPCSENIAVLRTLIDTSSARNVNSWQALFRTLTKLTIVMQRSLEDQKFLADNKLTVVTFVDSLLHTQAADGEQKGALSKEELIQLVQEKVSKFGRSANGKWKITPQLDDYFHRFITKSTQKSFEEEEAARICAEMTLSIVDKAILNWEMKGAQYAEKYRAQMYKITEMNVQKLLNKVGMDPLTGTYIRFSSKEKQMLLKAMTGADLDEVSSARYGVLPLILSTLVPPKHVVLEVDEGKEEVKPSDFQMLALQIPGYLESRHNLARHKDYEYMIRRETLEMIARKGDTTQTRQAIRAFERTDLEMFRTLCNELFWEALRGIKRKQDFDIKTDRELFYCLGDYVDPKGTVNLLGDRSTQEDVAFLGVCPDLDKLPQTQHANILLDTVKELHECAANKEGGCTAGITLAYHTGDRINVSHAQLGHTSTFVVILDAMGDVKKSERINPRLHDNKVGAAEWAFTHVIGQADPNCPNPQRVPDITTKAYILNAVNEGEATAYIIALSDGATENDALGKTKAEIEKTVGDFVRRFASFPNAPFKIAAHLAAHAYENGVTDNISAAAVEVQKNQPAKIIAMFDGYFTRDVALQCAAKTQGIVVSQVQLQVAAHNELKAKRDKLIKSVLSKKKFGKETAHDEIARCIKLSDLGAHENVIKRLIFQGVKAEEIERIAQLIKSGVPEDSIQISRHHLSIFAQKKLDAAVKIEQLLQTIDRATREVKQESPASSSVKASIRVSDTDEVVPVAASARP